MSEKLLLFPFGGSAREALVAIQSCPVLSKRWQVLGFVDDDPSQIGKECCGVMVLGGRDILSKFSDAKVLAVPAHPDIYLKRKEIINDLGVNEERWATIIHSSSVVSHNAKIGKNVLIMPQNFVSTNTQIGNHCVILPNTIISHDAIIEDYCCLGGHVTVSGTVTIGAESYVGSAVSIKNDITIGRKSLIGVGANVVQDVKPNTVVAGNPAKELHKK